MPERVQLSRQRGWRMPPNTMTVARPTRWGNPFKIGPGITRDEAVTMFRSLVTGENDYWLNKAVELKLLGIAPSDYPWPYPSVGEIRYELAGRNLACWCRLDAVCHADVLIELANQPEPAATDHTRPLDATESRGA